MIVEACAKINWSLDITGEREDGYHLMDMLMQPVSLRDVVRLLPAEELTLATSGFPLLRPDENHLALRAARLLREETGCPRGAALSALRPGPPVALTCLEPILFLVSRNAHPYHVSFRRFYYSKDVFVCPADTLSN